MRLVLLSDTHRRHNDIEVPGGDVLIHAGDFSLWRGTLEELAEFNAYLSALPHKHKIVVAGNHDECFEQSNAESRAILTAAHYLQDEGIGIGHLQFYGSPWQPQFMDFAFNLSRGAALRDKWDLIPSDIDVLITHGPPHGIGDLTHHGDVVGCEDLLARVLEIKPKLHVFGHIHEGRGIYEVGDTLFVNAARRGDERAPFVVDL